MKNSKTTVDQDSVPSSYNNTPLSLPPSKLYCSPSYWNFNQQRVSFLLCPSYGLNEIVLNLFLIRELSETNNWIGKRYQSPVEVAEDKARALFGTMILQLITKVLQLITKYVMLYFVVSVGCSNNVKVQYDCFVFHFLCVFKTAGSCLDQIASQYLCRAPDYDAPPPPRISFITWGQCSFATGVQRRAYNLTLLCFPDL